MSEEKELNEEVKNETTSDTQDTATEEQVQETVAEETQTEETVEETVVEPTPEEKYAELNDKFLRLYSEFDNYRKRTNKEKLELISTASSGVIKDLVAVLDDFERAITNNETVEDTSALKEGFNLIHNKLKGVKQMEAKGQPFDSELHEAIANIPAPTEDLKGKIVDDVEKGYYIHDKVIRYAKVVVGQ